MARATFRIWRGDKNGGRFQEFTTEVEQGMVVLRVLIDEQGVACSIEIETSSGSARLDHAAREAVERAAFRPYIEDGSPRRAFVLIPIEFSLNRSSV